jgi:WD40 repeat protein
LFEVTAIDAKIRRWRIECGVNRAVACGPAIPGEVAALSSDGARMAVGDMAVVTLWDLAADGGKPRRSFRTHDGQTFALAFSVDGQILAAAGERAVTVWHTAPACGREMRFGITGVRSIAFAPDGRSLAVGDKAGFVRVLDLLTGRQQRAFRGHGCQVTALAFSDDSRELASASDMEKVACLWDPTTGRSLGALRGHTKRLLSLAFAPGGQTLVTSGADSTVRLWDLPTGRVRTTLRNIEVGATAVAFSPDGRSLTAGGIEPEVWVWDISRMLGP